jgi:hypothetical protein
MPIIRFVPGSTTGSLLTLFFTMISAASFMRVVGWIVMTLRLAMGIMLPSSFRSLEWKSRGRPPARAL